MKARGTMNYNNCGMSMLSLMSVLIHSLFVLLPCLCLPHGVFSKFDKEALLDRFPRVYQRRRYKRQRQKVSRVYKYLEYEEMRDILIELAEDYPDLTLLETAQDTYGIPTAGDENDCPFDHHMSNSTSDRLLKLHERYVAMGKVGFPKSLENIENGCINWILTIEDGIAHPEGFDSYKSLPEVFIGGAMHGTERVGPTVAVETARLILEAAHCESLPHMATPSPSEGEELWQIWGDQMEDAKKCRESLSERGFSDEDRKWFARLVTTRRIVIVPTANALGYYRNERDEDGIDPMTDFPYDLPDNVCMRTIAARTINEIFQQHMFQLGMNFHTGRIGISYEWGSNSHGNSMSPDDEAQFEISNGYANFGGKFSKKMHWKVPAYKASRINQVEDPMRGLMEDWSYAGSWDKELVGVCHPTTYGEYPDTKTTYDNSTLRVINTFVSTSVLESPKEDHLGSNKFLLDPSSRWNGHVPRNIRLTLMMMDIVEPYVHITEIASRLITDDIVPLRRRADRACMKSKAVNIPAHSGNISTKWTVGGGFNIYNTGILYVKWSDLSSYFDEETQPSGTTYDDFVNVIGGADSETIKLGIPETTTTNARTRWHIDGTFPDNKKFSYRGPTLSAKIDASGFVEGDTVAVLAFAQLDKYWESKPARAEPSVPSQSHIVNARTNPNWEHNRLGKTIKGRVYWFSTPLTLVFGAPGSPIIESSLRLPVSEKKQMGSLKKLLYHVETHPEDIFYAWLASVTLAIILACCVCCRMSRVFYSLYCEICCCHCCCCRQRKSKKNVDKKMYQSVIQDEGNNKYKYDDDSDDGSDDDSIDDDGITLETLDTELAMDSGFAVRKSP